MKVSQYYQDIINGGFFENSPTIVMLWENYSSREIVAVSANIANICGHSAHDATNDTCLYSNLIHPDDGEKLQEELSSVSAATVHSKRLSPYRIKSFSGGYRWIDETIIPLSEKGSSVPQYVSYLIDITVQKEVENKLIESKKIVDEAQRLAKVGSWNLDLRLNELHWSDEIYHIFEIDPDVFNPSYEGFLNAIHPEDVEKVQEAFSKSLENKTNYSITHRLKMKDGRIKYVVENGKTVYGDDGTPLFSQGTVQDITDHKQLLNKLQNYISLVDENIITSSTDLDGNIVYASKAFCRISQYTESELLGKNHRMIRHPDMPASLYKSMWETILDNKTWEGDIKNKAKDGTFYWVHASISPVWNEEGKKTGYTAIRQDITDKKRIEALSVTDPLTGLYNRLKLDDVYAYEFAQAHRYHMPFSVIMLDMDHFKNVNDTFGHQTGDIVLKEIADLLRSHARESDTVGRWGGEEFLIILPNTNGREAFIVGEKIRQAVESHIFPVVGNKTVSIGIAEFNRNDGEHSMISRADKALYKAKTDGRNRVVAG